jgi:hypothetical protein
VIRLPMQLWLGEPWLLPAVARLAQAFKTRARWSRPAELSRPPLQLWAFAAAFPPLNVGPS